MMKPAGSDSICHASDLPAGFCVNHPVGGVCLDWKIHQMLLPQAVLSDIMSLFYTMTPLSNMKGCTALSRAYTD
jgi:hypothetical protein